MAAKASSPSWTQRSTISDEREDHIAHIKKTGSVHRNGESGVAASLGFASVPALATAGSPPPLVVGGQAGKSLVTWPHPAAQRGHTH